MPSFRTLPPSLRPVARAKVAEPDAQSIHVPVARAMVDCAVYVDGQRLPGKYTHAAALAKARELQGQEAFAWAGLYEPDQAADADGRGCVRDARAGRGKCGGTPIGGRSWSATSRLCFWC